MPTINKQETLFDFVLAQAGTIEGMFDVALLNSVAITDDVAAGTVLNVEQKEYSVQQLAFDLVEQTQAQVLEVGKHLNLVDVAAITGGSVDQLFSIAMANGVSITADIAAGAMLQMALEQLEQVDLLIQPYTPEADAIILKKQQNNLDFVTQHSGTLEGLFDMALRNSISITETIAPGTALKVQATDEGVVDHFKKRKIDVTSIEASNAVQPGGIGYMQIGTSFKVS
jgi:hypothetical protein